MGKGWKNFQEALFYPFHTDNYYYIYDSGTNNIVRVSLQLFQFLTGGDEEINELEIGEEALLSELNRAQDELGLFSLKKGDARLSFLEYEDLEYIERVLNSQLEQLILEVTQDCNMRCDYCVYSGKYHFRRKHQPLYMPRDIALKGIKYFFDRASTQDPPHVGFYGGEPLLNAPLILECIDFAREQNPRTQFDITTNGTLLSLDLVEFLCGAGVNLRISLDGPEEIHNRFRHFNNGEGSYPILIKNLRALKKNFPDFYREKISFHVTLAPDVDLQTLRPFLESLGVDPGRISYGLIDPFDNDFSEGKFKKEILGEAITEELYLYASTFSLHQGNYIFGSLFETTLGRIANRRITQPKDKGYVAGSCLPGRHRLFLNAQGAWYPCEKLDFGFSIGTLEKGLDIKLIHKKMMDLKGLLEGYCSSCWAFRLCDACFVTVTRGAEISEERLKEFCPLERQFLGKLLKAYAIIRECYPGQIFHLTSPSENCI